MEPLRPNSPFLGLEGAELIDIEMKVNRIETLRQEVQQKNEQLSFVAKVIDEKKSQYDQLREQHAEQIHTITRQARRQRARNTQRTVVSRLTDIDLGPTAAELNDESTIAEALHRGVDERLDVAALDRTLGAKLWRPLLNVNDEQNQNQLSRSDAALRLEEVRKMLEEKTKLVHQLRQKLVRHRQNSDATAAVVSNSSTSTEPYINPSVSRMQEGRSAALQNERNELIAETRELLEPLYKAQALELLGNGSWRCHISSSQ